jgi:hypothetical protein
MCTLGVACSKVGQAIEEIWKFVQDVLNFRALFGCAFRYAGRQHFCPSKSGRVCQEYPRDTITLDRRNVGIHRLHKPHTTCWQRRFASHTSLVHASSIHLQATLMFYSTLSHPRTTRSTGQAGELRQQARALYHTHKAVLRLPAVYSSRSFDPITLVESDYVAHIYPYSRRNAVAIGHLRFPEGTKLHITPLEQLPRIPTCTPGYTSLAPCRLPLR